MKCKRCGKILEKDGELCDNCYQELQNMGNQKAKKKELLKVKKKYSPKYILTKKLFEVYVVFVFLAIICFMAKSVVYGILSLIALFLIVFMALVISKKNAMKTYMIFYEDKIVFKKKVLWVQTERTLSYDEVKDITMTQGSTFLERTFQKKFNFGNIYVYPKKGNILTHGMQLEIVDKIDQTVEDIKNVVGDKIK